LLARGGWIAAVVGVGLLVADVVLPVPSSLVMILHGALFGVVVGTLLSLAGSLGAALFGFWIGRRGGPLFARLVPEDERLRADALLQTWGDLALIVTLAGSLPAALLYALTGATARSLDNAVLVFSLVLLVAGLFWAIGKFFLPLSRRVGGDGRGGSRG